MPLRELDLLIIQIRTGLTWTRVARVSRYEARRERGKAHARKAYDGAVKLLEKTFLRQSEAASIRSNLMNLRTELRRLGEDV
jgi:hypothetical protein